MRVSACSAKRGDPDGVAVVAKPHSAKRSLKKVTIALAVVAFLLGEPLA